MYFLCFCIWQNFFLSSLKFLDRLHHTYQIYLFRYYYFLQYSVQDAVSSELLGYFFLDLYPRDGKYGHACMMPLQPGYKKDKSMKEMDLVNICVMLANFSKPTDKKPALLGK